MDFGEWRFELVKVSRWLWLSAIPVSVLLFDPWSILPYELDRTDAFRLLTGLAWAAWLMGRWQGGANGGGMEIIGRKALRPYGCALALLGISMAISALLAENVWVAVLGSFDRQMGLLTWLSALLYLWLGMKLLDSRQWQQRVLLAVVGSATVAALYSIAQHYGFDLPSLHSLQAWGGVRVFSTLGHPNFLGAVLVMILPVTVGMAMGNGARPGGAQRAAPLRRLMLIGAFVQSVALAYTLSRGAWVGAAAGMGVFAFLALRGKAKWRLAILISVLIISTGLTLMLGQPQGLRAQWAQRWGSIGERLATLTDLSQGSGAIRLATWERLVEMWHAASVKRQVFGWGPDGIGLLLSGWTLPTGIADRAPIDRAHNVILDGLFNFGLVGAGLGLALVAMFAYGTIRRWRAIEGAGLKSAFAPAGAPTMAGLIGGLVAYGAQNLFSFEVVGTIVPAVAVAAVAWRGAGAMANPPKLDGGKGLPSARPPLPRGVGGICLAVAAVAIVLNIPPSVAGIHARQAQSALAVSDGDGAMQALGKALRWNPWQGRYYGLLAQARVEQAKWLPLEQTEFLFDQAALDLAMAMRYGYPQREGWYNIARVQSAAAEIVEGPTQAMHRQWALRAFSQAAPYYQGEAGFWLGWGRELLADGQEGKARVKFNRAVLLEPRRKLEVVDMMKSLENSNELPILDGD